MINLTIKPNKFLEQYIDYFWIFESESYQNIEPQLVYPLGNMEMMFHELHWFAARGFRRISGS